jgi:hypothetical protein
MSGSIPGYHLEPCGYIKHNENNVLRAILRNAQLGKSTELGALSDGIQGLSECV